jgi:hypothetical protein
MPCIIRVHSRFAVRHGITPLSIPALYLVVEDIRSRISQL